MRIGVTYPQTEIEADPGAVRHFAQAVEQMGYTHVLAFDHVLGANRASRPDRTLPYGLESQFHEPMVMFSFMAAATTTLEFVTGVMVLPQRQAVLAAKQAACLDVLSGGRFRLGIGTGWNDVEYEALGMDFASRGARMEEQVGVMRALWTKDAVDFKGAFHTITDAGLNPLPARPIPVWFGGGGDRPHFGQTASLKALRRIARIGDGWIQPLMPYDRARELIDTFHGFCREEGRDPASIGIEIRLNAHAGNEAEWADTAQTWREMGASHLTVTSLDDGLYGVDAHLARLEKACQALGVGPA